jgi:hypothetical protein
MKTRYLRACIVLASAWVSRTALAQTHIVPPPIPPLVTPAIPPCTVRGIPLNLDKIRSMQGVVGIVADADKLKVTVLFDNADVLKVQSSGCYVRAIDVRFWTETSSYDAPALKLKAQKITDMLLDASLAKGIDRSIDATAFNYGSIPIRSVDGPGYVITIAQMPLGGIGTFMKVIYSDNGIEGEVKIVK